MSTQRPTLLARTYTNLVLTAIAVCLGVIAFAQSSAAPAAVAQEASQVGIVGGGSASTESAAAGLINAAEQRKTMIAELRALGSRMERIEAALAKGINVKVTSMPEGDRDRGSDRASDRAPARPAN